MPAPRVGAGELAEDARDMYGLLLAARKLLEEPPLVAGKVDGRETVEDDAPDRRGAVDRAGDLAERDHLEDGERERDVLALREHRAAPCKLASRPRGERPAVEQHLAAARLKRAGQRFQER